MSAPRLACDAPSRGLPFLPPYVYRGTGQDMLTPPPVMAAWTNRVRARAGITAEPRTKAEVARLAAAELELAGTAPAWSGPQPAQRGRHEACGYLYGSRGHETACGGTR